MRRRIGLGLACLIMIVTISMNISTVAYGEMALKDVKNGVVRILTNDGIGYYQGSGFAIGIEGEPVTYIVTNYHVVQDMIKIDLYFDEENQYPLEVTDIVFRDNDIAVVKLLEPLDTLQPLIIETEIDGESGDRIYALGFPGISDALDETFTGYPDDITVTSGIISKIAETNNTKFYQIDAAISGGNSGGPLINEQGYVIGINSFGMINDDGSAAAGYNGSYLLDRLIRKLEDKKIDFIKSEDIVEDIVSTEVTSTPTQDKEQTKDNKQTEVEEESTKVVGNAIHQKPIIMQPMVILAIGVGILLVIALLVGRSMSQRKKKIMQQQRVITPTPIIPVPVAIKKHPQLVGISGYQVGRVYNIEGIINFGRNPASKVPYPENYKGISGNHCILQYDSLNDLFLLSDMGSSYGTFLENGQMIEKNRKIALKYGDKFYLADSQEMFQIRQG